MLSCRTLRPWGIALGLLVLGYAPVVAQSDVGGSREAPPAREAPARFGVLAVSPSPVAPQKKPVLRYASLDLFGDSSEATGGSLFAKFGFAQENTELKRRLTGAIVFDPVTSSAAGTTRQTGVGDLWLRAGVLLFTEAGWRPKIVAQGGVKVPTASADRGLGSGHADERIRLGFDKTLPHDIWTNVSIQETFKGQADGTPAVRVDALIVQAEIPLSSRLKYAGFLQANRLFSSGAASTAQQHGGSVHLGTGPIWLGAGLSLERAAGDWNPGGYARLEWMP